MRCLYCGKELALLKRWTGGGEFCSDAHRQRYQEEYNQLALNRLLQAKPPAEPQPDPAHPPQKREAAPVTTAEPVEPKPARREPVSVPAEVPVYAETKIEIEDVEPPPADMAGFITELPASAVADVATMAHPELELLDSAPAAALPLHAFDAGQSQQDAFQLEPAGLQPFPLSNQASNYASTASRDKRLEVREFLRTAPIIEVDLKPAGETGLETANEPMDFSMIPQAPQESPALWQESPVGFSQIETELGDLGRLAFGAAGLSEGEQAEAPAASTLAVEQPVVAVHVDLPPQPVAEPERVAPVEEPVLEPVIAAQERRIPDAATQPLVVTIRATAPGKGKTTQVYASAQSGIQVQVPRSASLPLRSVMTFGPAPVKEAVKEPVKEDKPVQKLPEKKVAPVAVKSEPKKTTVAAPAVRPGLVTTSFRRPFAENKPAVPAAVKAEVKVEAKDEKVAAPEPAKPAPAAKADAPKAPQAAPKPEPKQERKPARPAEPMPAPLSPPYPGTNDMGLPRLNLQPSPGIWSRMPVFVKIAVALVMIAGLGTVIALSSKSGGAAVPSAGAGTVVAGPTLPVGDAGWITDWGGDPGVRRTRQISVLRSSQTYTDYRIEMQAQIETKAVGWVFRAADARNFYVTKLEIVKPGLEPTVALIRFAVINGEEQARAQLPLNLKVRRDTMFKIRFDAVGSRFTTYVQDEKVDEWTDDHVKTGGVGLYSERGENASLKGGMSVVPLVVRK